MSLCCLSEIQANYSYSFSSIGKVNVVRLICIKNSMFYIEIHLVKWLSKSKIRLGHLS